jgi:hypothetical protein
VGRWHTEKHSDEALLAARVLSSTEHQPDQLLAVYRGKPDMEPARPSVYRGKPMSRNPNESHAASGDAAAACRRAEFIATT